MNIMKITCSKAPEAIGPYSQAVRSGRMVFVSGQLPIGADKGKFAGAEIADQTYQSLKNIQTILIEVGMDMNHVVKTTVFLSRMEDFPEMNRVYSTFFSDPFPARVAFEVARLPKDALVEIEAVAIMD